jgi:hypothetical protein
MNNQDGNSQRTSEFARQGEMKRGSFVGEFFHMVRTKRKWWILPLVLILVAFGVMMVLSSSGVAPFIYTVF